MDNYSTREKFFQDMDPIIILSVLIDEERGTSEEWHRCKHLRLCGAFGSVCRLCRNGYQPKEES